MFEVLVGFWEVVCIIELLWVLVVFDFDLFIDLLSEGFDVDGLCVLFIIWIIVF